MKKRIITSALALALAFSLCACTDNTSATESYSDSTGTAVTPSEASSFVISGIKVRVTVCFVSGFCEMLTSSDFSEPFSDSF